MKACQVRNSIELVLDKNGLSPVEAAYFLGKFNRFSNELGFRLKNNVYPVLIGRCLSDFRKINPKTVKLPRFTLPPKV